MGTFNCWTPLLLSIVIPSGRVEWRSAREYLLHLIRFNEHVL